MENYTKYNQSRAAGEIFEISPIEDKNGHRLITFALKCVNEDGNQPYRAKFLHLKAWNDIADQVATIPEGSNIQVQFSVQSKQNLQRPGLWYHVLTLKAIL